MEKDQNLLALIESYLNRLRREFETAPSGKTILDALTFCAVNEVNPPGWLMDAFVRRMNCWYSLRCRTLDEAFDVQWRKGKHLAAEKKRRRLEFAVLNEVNHRKMGGASINADLFSAVGMKFAIGKTLAEEFYRSALSKVAASPPEFLALLEPHMTSEARRVQATRKIRSSRGSE